MLIFLLQIYLYGLFWVFLPFYRSAMNPLARFKGYDSCLTIDVKCELIIHQQENISDEPYYLVMTLSENVQNLRRVKIQFENEQDEKSGFYELMASGMPALALDKGRYLANALQLKILEQNGINYMPDV
jgi:hypothetical protein